MRGPLTEDLKTNLEVLDAAGILKLDLRHLGVGEHLQPIIILSHIRQLKLGNGDKTHHPTLVLDHMYSRWRFIQPLSALALGETKLIHEDAFGQAMDSGTDIEKHDGPSKAET